MKKNKIKSKICFLGNAKISLSALRSIMKNDNFEIVLVVTNSNKISGRGQKKVKPNLVANFANQNNLPLFQTDDLNSDSKWFKNNHQFDYLVTCSFSQILSKEILKIPQKKAINIHCSLLPKGRGGAPIHRAILNRETTTGITIMEMNEKMDEGDYFLKHQIKINTNETYDSLHQKLSKLIEKTFANDLLKIENGIKQIKQNSKLSSYWYILKKDEEKIDFDDFAEEIERKIRALNSYPGAFANINNLNIKIFKATILHKKSQEKPGKILNITKKGITVSTKNYDLLIDQILIPGKKILHLQELINGRLPFIKGDFFN